MKTSDLPVKFPVPFGASSDSGDIRQIPLTTTDPTAASLQAGFPPATFTPVGAGGSPPDGRDFQGLFNQDTAWARWFSAGGPIPYDATFQAAVGGYPKGSIIQTALAASFGTFYYCLVDDNVTNPDAGGAGWQSFQIAVQTPTTGAQLQIQSATILRLAPYAGGYLWINGTNYPVPAGLTIDTNSTGPNALYFIYAYFGTGAMHLEASTTGYVLSANGIAQKAGDATRSLVGAAYTDGANQFNDSLTKRNVVSWYNRTSRALNGPSTNSNVSSTIPLEIQAGCRVEAVVWSTQGTIANVVGTTQIGGANLDIAQVFVGVDGVATGYGTSSLISGNTFREMGAVASLTATLADGRHVWSPFGLAAGGTSINFQVGAQVLIGA